jgi:hypothetical protein
LKDKRRRRTSKNISPIGANFDLRVDSEEMERRGEMLGKKEEK